MKKFLLPLLALALSATAASAQDTQAGQMGGGGMQDGGQRRSPEEMAATQTKRLTQELSLTPDQAAKVQQIMLNRQKDMQAIRSQPQGDGDRSQMREQMQTMRTKYNDQFKAVLTPDQYTKFTAMEQQRGGGRGMGQGMGQGNPNQSSDTNTKVKDSDGKVKIKVKPSDN